MVNYQNQVNILKKNEDFNRIINSYKAFKYKDYIIYVEKGVSGPYKFGFSVGKKIGNAVTRNKYKRRLCFRNKNFADRFN